MAFSNSACWSALISRFFALGRICSALTLPAAAEAGLGSPPAEHLIVVDDGLGLGLGRLGAAARERERQRQAGGHGRSKVEFPEHRHAAFLVAHVTSSHLPSPAGAAAAIAGPSDSSVITGVGDMVVDT